MKLRLKVTLLAIVPLILALAAIALFVRSQADSVARQQRATIHEGYLAGKKIDLKQSVDVARHSIEHLYESGRADSETLSEAKRILSTLSSGDSYLFVYDMKGNCLVHPQQELVGNNLWDLQDEKGGYTIRMLIARANLDGGFEQYDWKKPSSGKTAPKLGYVIRMEKWGWMMGTGIYLDDVEAALNKIDGEQSRIIQRAMLWIAVLAILSAVVVGGAGFALYSSERRVADAKLQAMAQRVVGSQEQERARLSRDLHDGISQCLVSIKLQIEAGLVRLTGNAAEQQTARSSFEQTAGQLHHVLGEVRRISHDLRPAILDDLGLAAALDHLAHEFRENSGTPAHFVVEGSVAGIPDVVNTVLFRVAQEALTNIERHADAHRIDLKLVRNGNDVALTIADDGHGFDPAGVAIAPNRGIGLRNMIERMEMIGGQLTIDSSDRGTSVKAAININAEIPA